MNIVVDREKNENTEYLNNEMFIANLLNVKYK